MNDYKIKKGFFEEWKYDIPAGLVVFLVAVPLCLGIALASGAPLFSGIIAGVIGGIIVGAISGSQLGVSGPAAGLAVIVLNAITDLGSFEAFLLALIIAGAIQILLGLLKAGLIGYYFPSSVIKGMLSGIGIIIILKQIPHALGYDKDPEGEIEFIQPDGHNTFNEILYTFENFTLGAVVISLLSLAVLILWERPFFKKFTLVQGPLVVVIMGIVLNFIFNNIPTLVLAPEHLVQIPVATNISSFLEQFSYPDFSRLGDSQIYITGLIIAVIASLETLLCVEATDKLDPYKRVTPTNLELLAQGAGNMLSGFVGGLPVTQVIVRSSANIQSGGRSKLAAIFHGILLLICAISIPHVLNMIPLSSLAAILIMVGYKLAKPSIFKSMFKQGIPQFIPFIVTILGLIFTDLLIGIILGLIVSIFYILYENYKNPYFFHPEEYHKGDIIKLELSEQVSFLNKSSILQTLNHLPTGSKVIIDASRSIQIDHDVREIIEDFRENARYRKIELTIVGLDKPDHEVNHVRVLSETVTPVE